MKHDDTKAGSNDQRLFHRFMPDDEAWSNVAVHLRVPFGIRYLPVP